MAEREDNAFYYCLFCRTTYEKKIMEDISRKQPELKSTSLYKDKWKITGGIRSTVKENMLPGYVFIRSEQALEHGFFRGMANVIRLLGNPDMGYALDEGNLKFAKWVFEYNGLIKTSLGYTVGGRVVITEGPLKDLEGSIEKVNKRRQVMLVNIGFDDKEIKVWLPFLYAREEEEGGSQN